MEYIRVYNETEEEYRKLEFFASVCNARFDAENKVCSVIVKNTYFDYGQGWKYTALVTVKRLSTWQSVCPRDYERILKADYKELADMAVYYAEEIIKDKICVRF